MTPAALRPRLIGVGLIAGLASGLLGLGGAVLMVPLLVRFADLTQHRAHGTSLAVTLFTASAALVGYARGGYLDFALALTLAAGSVVGSPLGARWAQATSAAVLRRAFGVLMLVVGIRLFLVNLPEGGLVPSTGPAGLIAHVVMGFVIGVASGYFGVGGGVVLVPALVLLTGLAQKDAQGVSLLFVIPTAIAGTWAHRKLGNVDLSVVPWLAGASVVAALAASLTVAWMPGQTLRILFGCVLVALGIRQALFPKHPRKAAAAK